MNGTPLPAADSTSSRTPAHAFSPTCVLSVPKLALRYGSATAFSVLHDFFYDKLSISSVMEMGPCRFHDLTYTSNTQKNKPSEPPRLQGGASKRKPKFTLGELIPQTPRNKPFTPVHSTGYSGCAVLKVPRSGTLHEIAQ
jgi:hypothetical protein